MPVTPTIQGLQEAQQINARQIAALKPSGAFGKAIKAATIEAQRYAMYITHVKTGGLRASHRMKITGLQGEVFIDPNAVNEVRRGARPAIYGAKEHERGGSHAFYARTEVEGGSRIASAAQSTILGEM